MRRAGLSRVLLLLAAPSRSLRCDPWCDECNDRGGNGGGYCCTRAECIGCIRGCSRPPPPPRPVAPPADWPSPPAPPPDTAEYWTEGSRIRTNAFALPKGDSLLIKGVSWFGLESHSCYIGGGDKGPLSAYAEFLKFHGFNAVRVPLAADALMADTAATCLNRGIYTTNNPELEGLGYVSLLERFVLLLGEHGLLVLLDVHNMHAGEWPERAWPAARVGVSNSVDTLHTAWAMLAKHFCDSKFWNVFGADLKNEPHGLYWGPQQDDGFLYASDMRWDTTAASLGTTVHRTCSRLLIFVEGVGHCRDDASSKSGGSNNNNNNLADNQCQHPAALGQDSSYNAFWGENLQGARQYPVQLIDERDGGPIDDKVVYSPHSYGPGVYRQPYFEGPDFAARLPKVWDTQYGFLARDSIAPVVVGEWGGRGEGDDAVWQQTFRTYLKDRRIGSFYWSLNPESSDTGGLIVEWSLPLRVEAAKLQMLSTLPSSPVPLASDRTWGGTAVYHRRAAFPRPPPPPPPPPVPALPSPIEPVYALPSGAGLHRDDGNELLWASELFGRFARAPPPAVGSSITESLPSAACTLTPWSPSLMTIGAGCIVLLIVLWWCRCDRCRSQRARQLSQSEGSEETAVEWEDSIRTGHGRAKKIRQIRKKRAELLKKTKVYHASKRHAQQSQRRGEQGHADVEVALTADMDLD